MSTWKPDSDLNRLNGAPVGQWVDLPAGLIGVLAASQRISRLTGGAFEIAVGDLVAAWGFGPAIAAADMGHSGAATSPTRVASLDALELNEGGEQARKLAPLALDLSGIAKGFAVDEMARVMREFGIVAWLVGIDGDLRGAGLKPDGAPWAVAHEKPDRTAREAMGVIELHDMAVATSGTYRHWRDVGGKVFSHTMDPRTGAPLTNTIASVTVLAPSCILADGWATAVMVAGADAGLALAASNHFDVIIVHDDGRIQSTL